MPRLPFRAALLGGTLLALAACGEKGPTIDEAGARKIENGIRQQLPVYFADSSGDVTFEFQGGPVAKPAKGHYEVALPRILAHFGDKEGTLDAGVITAKVTPLEDGNYGVEAALPATMAIKPAGGGETVTVGIAGGTWSGTWLPQIDMSLVNSLSVGKVVFSKGAEILSTLEGISGRQGATATANAPGKHDLTFSYAATGLRAGAGGTAFSLGEVRMEGSTAGSDMVAYMGIARALQEKTKAMQAATGGKDPSPAQLAGLFDDLGGVFKALGAMKATLSVKGLDIQAPGGKRVTLGDAQYSFGYAQAADNQGSLSFGLGYGGLSVSPTPPMQELVPTGMNLQLSAEKLPLAALGPAMKGLLAAEAAGEEGSPEREAAEQAAMMPLLGAFLQSGAVLTVERLDANAPAAGLDLKGTTQVKPGTPFNAVADFTLVLRDLDKAVKALGPQPGQKADESRAQAAMLLGMAQGMGTAGKTPEGATTHTFRIQVTETGQMLVNGQDFSRMMGAMGK